MKTGDVALAEDHIHRYFDFNGSDPLESLDTFANKAINGGASASASAADTTASISRIVSSMLALQAPFPRAELYASALSASRQLHPQGSPHASSTNTSTYIHRHQHAMITLATMWTLSGNYSMALSAVEEAMNTAHQREDHHSVTKALLLMFHIFKGGHAEELLAGAEDILVRCLKRCKALQMHRQISEIALLLAECRSRGPLKLSYRLSSEQVSGQALWSTADIFNHISAALLGNTLITCQVVSQGAATGTEEDAADEPSHKPTAIPLRNEAALLVDPVMKISPDLVSFSCKGTLLAASVWERLGMNHMADFSYRRYLRQFGLCSASEDILQIFCKMIFVKLDILCCSWRWRSSSSTIRENLLSSVKEVRQLLAKIHSIFPDKESYSVKIQESLSVCRHYSLALEAMMKGDWQRSTRLASQLVQMTGRGAADA
eukprot:gene20278-20858_t